MGGSALMKGNRKVTVFMLTQGKVELKHNLVMLKLKVTSALNTPRHKWMTKKVSWLFNRYNRYKADPTTICFPATTLATQ